MSYEYEVQNFRVERLSLPDGRKYSECWYAVIDGKEMLHRPDGPAVTHWDIKTQKISGEGYWIKDQTHRIDGPALIEYDPTTGNVMRESWYLRDELDRQGWEPAVIEYDGTGNVVHTEYYSRGEKQEDLSASPKPPNPKGPTI